MHLQAQSVSTGQSMIENMIGKCDRKAQLRSAIQSCKWTVQLTSVINKSN